MENCKCNKTEDGVLYYSKTREVKDIVRGTDEASGIDFFVPKFTTEFINDLMKKNPGISEFKPGCSEYIILDFENVKKIILAPHARILIPSGIKVRGTKGISLDAANKSGISTKKGLNKMAEIVDSDYQGEIHISVLNTTPFMIEICEDEKLIQFIQRKIELHKPVEICEEKLFVDDSVRGEGGFGSTNK